MYTSQLTKEEPLECAPIHVPFTTQTKKYGVCRIPKTMSKSGPRQEHQDKQISHLMMFSLPPILGVTTERREADEGATTSTLSVIRTPLKLVAPMGPVNADTHAAPPTSTAIVRTI